MVKMHAYSCNGCSKVTEVVSSCGKVYGHRDPRYLTDFLGSFTLKRHEICQAFELGFTLREILPYLMRSLKFPF